jgi:hypothetical protein
MNMNKQKMQLAGLILITGPLGSVTPSSAMAADGYLRLELDTLMVSHSGYSATVTTIDPLPSLDLVMESIRSSLGIPNGSVLLSWSPFANITVDYVAPTAGFEPFSIQGLVADVNYNLSYGGNTVDQLNSTKLGAYFFRPGPSLPTNYSISDTSKSYSANGNTHWEFNLGTDSVLKVDGGALTSITTINSTGWNSPSGQADISTLFAANSNMEILMTANTAPAQFVYEVADGVPAYTGSVPVSTRIDKNTAAGMHLYINYGYEAYEKPSAPFMPVSNTGSDSFSFNQSGTVLINGNTFNGGFYDPDVAVGYTYEATDVDTFFDKLMIPGSYGDGKFSLLVWDDAAGAFIDTGVELGSGNWFELSSLGISNPIKKFRVEGIEVTANVDPSDPRAFVTGLVFGGTGHAFTMTAMTQFVEPTVSVPEPETYAMMLAGLGLVGWAARRRQTSSK